ncbi:unnamed protein product [Caretta caretta]
MAASRLPPAALTLKQFLRRQQVLQLYRRILQAIRQVPTETDRHYLKEWAREEFKRNKDATDERIYHSSQFSIIRKFAESVIHTILQIIYEDIEQNRPRDRPLGHST